MSDILGIYQPYFFPYLGYFQLIDLVDRFVIYDDVNYIKGGWINRNSILLNGAAHRINLGMNDPSPNKKINENEVSCDSFWRTKLLKTIEMNYRKAPYFSEAYPVIEDIINNQETNLATYMVYAYRKLCDYMDIKTELIISSSIEKDNSLKGQDKVIHICKLLGADTYCNSIGGTELYDKTVFRENGINLYFHSMDSDIAYPQFGKEFVPNLSIIDVMMFNSVEDIRKLLRRYTLV